MIEFDEKSCEGNSSNIAGNECEVFFETESGETVEVDGNNETEVEVIVNSMLDEALLDVPGRKKVISGGFDSVTTSLAAVNANKLPDVEIQSNDESNDSEITDNEELSEYEKIRARSIREQKIMLKKLNIMDLKKDLQRMTNDQKSKKRKYKKSFKPKEPAKKSLRIASQLPSDRDVSPGESTVKTPSKGDFR